MVTASRLRSSADIRAVVSSRCAVGGDVVVVHARMTGTDRAGRVAVVAGRRVGGAVRRNRAKRRIRAVLCSMDLPDGTDLVVSAKQGADTVAFVRLTNDIHDCVRRALIRASRRGAVPA